MVLDSFPGWEEFMKTLLNCLALATVGTVAGSNIYWQWANVWIACIVALAATFAVCLTAEKIAVRISHRKMKRDFGADWGKQ